MTLKLPSAALAMLFMFGAAPLALAQTAPAPAAAARLSTAATTIGTLIDNPVTKAILDRHMPGFSDNPQVGMARGMTLRAIQAMVPDMIKIEALDKIDAELAAL